MTERRVETAHSATRLTYADYLGFPDDRLRHEIIAGEHYVTPSPVTQHQRIVGNLYYFLRLHLSTHPVGEVFSAPFDVLLSTFDVVVPDLIYLSRERAHFLTEKNLQGAPDLVVEVLSPGTRTRDLRLKRDLYERVGVGEYWAVDPASDHVSVYGRPATGFPKGGFSAPLVVTRAAAEHLATRLLPGFNLPLESIFLR